jgi:hypothetical protein
MGGKKMKSFLIGIIVVILVVCALFVGYFLGATNGLGKLINFLPSGTVKSSLQQNGAINTPFGTVTPTQVNNAYSGLTQAQKDCLLSAVGQAKVDGFLKNDPAVMQTITVLDYAKAAACQK